MFKKQIVPVFVGLAMVSAIASNAAAGELEDRIIALEEEAMIATEGLYDINARDESRMKISGYTDVEYHTSSKANSVDGFRLHHMSLFFEMSRKAKKNRTKFTGAYLFGRQRDDDGENEIWSIRMTERPLRAKPRERGADLQLTRKHDGEIIRLPGIETEPDATSWVETGMRCGDKLTVYGDGTQTRSFCYVDDMIEAMMALMKYEGADAAEPV